MDREAVTAPVAMSIAVALFLGLFATIALTTNQVGGGGPAEATDAALLRAQASSLLDLMLQSPGYSDDGGGAQDWLGREDDLVRLGLREATGTGLSFDKFEKLRLAPYDADGTDGYVNYQEAREALGFHDRGLGFHIRSKPSLKSVEDILASGERDPNMRVTYLAASVDGGEVSGLTLSNLGCAADGGQLKVSLDITNGGLQAAQLSAFVTLTSSGSESTRSEWINGPDVAKDATVTLSSSFPFHDDPDTTDLCGTGATLTATVWDKTQELKSASVTLADAGVAGHAHGLNLDTGTQYTLSGQDASFAFGGEELGEDEDLEFELVGPDHAPATHTLTLDAGKVNKRTIMVGDGPTGHHTLDTGILVAGTYTATLTATVSGVTASETLYVFDTAPDDYYELGMGGGDAISNGGKAEVENLHDIVEQFCPFHHDDPLHGSIFTGSPTYAARCSGFTHHGHGDVVLDTKKNMDDDLPDRLIAADGTPRYDYVTTLVVGSNVNHQSMTSATAKHAVRDWVLGGGTLIVFGSSEQAVQWLQPIFHSGIQSSSGGIGTPDADHPLLHVTDTLDYSSYDDHGRVWDLKESGGQSSADKFTNVVTAGDDPTLAISDPGAYGSGTVILTTWMPYDIFGDGSDPGIQGPKLVNNLLTQSYRGLFLDYGPSLPQGQSVVPATGKAQIYHPELDRLISLDVTLFVFSQA